MKVSILKGLITIVFFAIVMTVVLNSASFADEPTVLSISSLSDQVDNSVILPKSETEEEARMRELGLWPIPNRDVDAPPVYNPVSMAEYWPMEGILIRFTGSDFESTYRGLIGAAQAEGLVWIWVSNSSTQTTVTNKIISWGIPMTNIRFLVSASNSIWMRDYGPSWIYNMQGDPEIIDFSYDRPRPYDDGFPSWLGTQWDIPVYKTNLLYEGGNFMADGCGTCFASNRIYDQNSHQYTQAQVNQIMRDYFGCERLVVLTHMTGDGTGHLDMFCKLLDIDTILLAQANPGHQDYTILENNAALLESLVASNGNPYNIIRIPMGNNYRCYTNSLIVNNKVIVPTYGISLDSTALGIYEAAMPGYEIVGVDSSSIINSNGAIHCITMGVPLPCPIAAAPTDIEIDLVGPDQLYLSWPEVEKAEGYRVYRSETGCAEDDMEFLAEIYVNDFLDDTIDETLSYFYRVSAFTYCRESAMSDCAVYEESCIHNGDVDFSGMLSSRDAQLAFFIALGMMTPTYAEACAADCDASGNVSSIDAQAIFLAALSGTEGCADPLAH
ncbi:MAG: agmatine deiminase family protein [bacterium]